MTTEVFDGVAWADGFLADLETEAATGIQVGDPVISWYHDRPVIWGGDPDGGLPHLSMNIGLATGTLSNRQYCSVDRVMPAGEFRRADSKDPRLNVEKRPTSEKPGPWVGGNWRLITPMPGGTTYTDWCKTKGVAVERGLRRLAILDYHAAAS